MQEQPFSLLHRRYHLTQCRMFHLASVPASIDASAVFRGRLFSGSLPEVAEQVGPGAVTGLGCGEASISPSVVGAGLVTRETPEEASKISSHLIRPWESGGALLLAWRYITHIGSHHVKAKNKPRNQIHVASFLYNIITVAAYYIIRSSIYGASEKATGGSFDCLY